MISLSAVKISFLKRADALLGKALVGLLSPPIFAAGSNSVATILIIRPGGIGDALLLAPALNQLGKLFTDASITVLAERRNASAFKLIPAVTRILCYDKPTELLTILRSSFDIVIDTEQWHRLSAVIARFVRSGIKLGYDTNERSRLYTHKVAYSHDEYEVISFLDLMKSVGVSPEFDPFLPFLTLPDRSLADVEIYLSGLSRPFITLFPGASIPERRWGVSRFRKLVMLLAEQGITTVVVGGPQDILTGKEIISGTSAINLAGRTSLDGTAAIISSSALLISGDSGVLHLAVGLGVPTVSLFGPGISKKWAPRSGRHKVHVKTLSCSPCTQFGYTPHCNFKVRCLAEISPEEVYTSVIALWEFNSR